MMRILSMGRSGERRRIWDAAEDGGHGELDAQAAERNCAVAADKLRPAASATPLSLCRAQTQARGSSWLQMR